MAHLRRGSYDTRTELEALDASMGVYQDRYVPLNTDHLAEETSIYQEWNMYKPAAL